LDIVNKTTLVPGTAQGCRCARSPLAKSMATASRGVPPADEIRRARRNEIDRVVVGPSPASGRFGRTESLRGAAGDRDLAQVNDLTATGTKEPEPTAVGREERGVAAARHRHRLRFERVEGAQIHPVLSLDPGVESDSCAVGRDCDAAIAACFGEHTWRKRNR
jgi:hypothetical protein